MNQQEFADRLEISKAFVSLILSGQRNAGKFLARELARITNTPVETWTTGPAEARRRAFELYAAGEQAQ